ncbi:MAG TPA: cupredoxin domain-containing protein [Blastococcus sp.]|jgi:plastocyanin|nr:cupredoxin domain-containing protein [Blastococcus sp.]
MTNSPTTQRGRRSRRLLLIAPACALVLATAACGGSGGASSAMSSMSSGAASASSGTAATDTIHIEKFAYRTPPSVSPGATVSVMNVDGEAHTVTADSGNAFDVMATPGKTVTFTAPSTPGRYAFHCTYHSNMHGVLVVK